MMVATEEYYYRMLFFIADNIVAPTEYQYLNVLWEQQFIFNIELAPLNVILLCT